MDSIHQPEADSGVLIQENLRKLQGLRLKQRRAATDEMREDIGRQIREISDTNIDLKSGVSIQPKKQ